MLVAINQFPGRRVSMYFALATWLAVLFSPSHLSAAQSFQQNSKQECERLLSVTVPAEIIERMVRNGRPVNFDRILVKGQLNLVGQVVKESLEIKHSIVDGQVNVSNAFFAKRVDFTGSCFAEDVTAYSSHFSNDAIWNETTLLGKFVYSGASIGGCSTFNGAFLAKGNFDGMRVGRCASFERTVFQQDANFLNMVIAEQVSFEGAVFEGTAIFERADIGGSAYFREENATPATHFKGAADFKATKIGGQANFNDVIFDDEVTMTRAQFDEGYFWNAKFAANTRGDGHNDVSFEDAEFRMLDFGGRDKLAWFAPGRKVKFTGLAYRRLNTPLPLMLEILEQSGYDRQPYNQLEKVYRDSGQTPSANLVYFTRRRLEGSKLFPLSSALSFSPLRVAAALWGWLWDRTQRYVFGYGVYASYPLSWLIGLFILSTLLLSRPHALVAQRKRNTHRKENEQRKESEQVGGMKYSSLTLKKRLATSLGMNLDLVIPRATLPVARRWRISENLVELYGFHIRLRYHQFASLAKWVAWAILTVSLGLFSAADLIRG